MKTMEKKGFTLIELLIVIAIIGILAVAFLPSLLGAPAKGRDAQRLSTVQKIENFLVTEMLAGETLPGTDGCIVGGTNPTDIGKLIDANIANFGGVFPMDPQTGIISTGAAPECTGSYGFISFSTNTDYTAAVFAAVEELENANIPCADIKDVAAGIALSTPDPDTDALCYIALIQ